MMPAIHCSAGNISLFPIGSFRPCREIQIRNFCGSERHSRSRKAASLHHRLLLPQPAFRLIGIYKRTWSSTPIARTSAAATVGTGVTVEDDNPASSGEASDENSEGAPVTSEASEQAEASTAPASSTPKLGRNIRKSEMPPVKDEDLVPGASFTGKVRSIKPFGVFVDFGAFTEGLVHISRASDGYVKDISSLFTVGQEVTVRIVEANKETGRISLTMRTGGDYSKPKKEVSKDASGERNPAATVTRSSPRSQTKERAEPKKIDESKYVPGQALTGTVKNTTKAGTFVSLPDGHEGFLPREEEAVALFTLIGQSALQVGQQVDVKVLNVARGQLTLTMKEGEDGEDDDLAALNRELKQEQTRRTNAFELAFRRSKEISAFLDQREKAKAPEAQAVAGAILDTNTDAATSSYQTKDKGSKARKAESVEIDSLTTEDKECEASKVATLEVDSLTTTTEEVEDDSTIDDTLVEPSATDSATEAEGKEEDSPSTEAAASTLEDASLPSVTPDDPAPDDAKDTATLIDAVKDSADASIEDKTTDGKPLDAPESVADVVNKEDEDAQENEESVQTSQESSPDSAVSEVSSQEKIEDSSAVVDTVDDQTVQSDSLPMGGIGLSSNGAPENVTAASVSEAEDKPAEPEDSSAVEEVPVTNGAEQVAASSETASSEVAAAGAEASATTATISPTLVKQLREETGAGMMDCKKALAESGGDLEKAQEFLRKKGLATADKKAGRATAEGRVSSYIHDSRIGVLIEVNCETDFVSRGDIFKELGDDLAMQVAACPQVKYVSTDDIPEELVNKEKEMEMQKEDLLLKPEQIRSKIVEGRVKKRLSEFALLEQPFIKNDKMTVNDWVKQTIATIGENMRVKRFVRYNLGEGLEKKSQDFAAEVAAQTMAKPPPAAPPKDDKAAESTETAEKKPTVAVSAALVKQLREETGAGMMDCKRALSETGGDLEKAQEYLRKKGLSSADKKSSRLAAEGLISSYIHDSRIGCLIEVNSETDFVARNEKFKELVGDLAMQVVACPQVEFVSVEDIPESVINKEKELEMQREDLESKPENIRQKIVEGRISKRLGALALLDQPFLKDDSKTVKDVVKETIAALGENIKVRRFVRYTLGEN